MPVKFAGVIVGGNDMSEDVNNIRIKVLKRLKAQRAEVAQDLAERPGDAATRARLQNLETCIAALHSAFEQKIGTSTSRSGTST